MVARATTRRDDRMALIMLKWRCRGMSPAKIARRLGVLPNYVKTLTKRIRAADIAESGESNVAASYLFKETGRPRQS